MLLDVVTKRDPYGWFPDSLEFEDPAFLANAGEAWLRWQATRRINEMIDPQCATGFEGFYKGLKLPPEEVANRIAQLGANTIQGIRLLHKNNPSYYRNLLRVANGELYDLSMLADLNGYLMANIGRLRVQVHPDINRDGDQFRQQIARLVENQRIVYHADNHVITTHEIPVPSATTQKPGLHVDQHTFTRDELREGYTFMQLLGRAGYPLARLAIRSPRR